MEPRSNQPIRTATPKKNIVLCSDGTGNTLLKGRGTNVFKLFESVDLGTHRRAMIDADDSEEYFEQIAFYDDGVGTSGFKPLKLLGGAFGYGLKRNVLDLYMALCRVYLPGDRIYLFGFSRGAYTARLLAGFIVSCGVIERGRWRDEKELRRLAEKAYQAFRQHFILVIPENERRKAAKKKQAEDADEAKSRRKDVQEAQTAVKDAKSKAKEITDAFRETYCTGNGEIQIEFVGVWDTVSAIGLPSKWLTDKWNRYLKFKFPDYYLSENVKKGCHALSIDDERLTFHPMLWNENPKRKIRRENHIEQVWFPGVHANIGGGYPKHGISLVSLDWMMQKAEQAGLKNCSLRFHTPDRERYRSMQNCHDWHYNSRRGLAIYYRYKPRSIQKFCDEFEVKTPKIHVSTMERIASATQDYAPISLPDEFEVVNYDSLVDTRLGEKIKIATGGLKSSEFSKDLKRWILFRHHSYWIFLTLTIATLVSGCLLRFTDIGEPRQSWIHEGLADWLLRTSSKVPGLEAFAEVLLGPFLFSLPFTVFALLVLGVTGLITLRARAAINRIASRYWRSKFSMPWWSHLDSIEDDPEANDRVDSATRT